MITMIIGLVILAILLAFGSVAGIAVLTVAAIVFLCMGASQNINRKRILIEKEIKDIDRKENL